MKKIKITSTPPGFAPEEVRKDWVGIEIPLQEGRDSGNGSARIGNENVGGHAVRTSDAIAALRAAGKNDAADFWSGYSNSSSLVFKKECCELVDA